MSRRKKQGMLGAVIAVAALVLVFQLALGMDPTTVFADDSGLAETQTVADDATNGEDAGSTDASAQSLSPVQSFEVTAENSVVVKVDAPEGALPEGVELHADVVSETEDVASELDNAGVSYDGFVALDVYFTNADGTEVEPAQAVDVRFELPSGLVPEDAESVSVQHLAEDETGAVTDVQTVADNSDTATLSEDSSADKGIVSVNDDSTVTAEFSVDGFSGFTITWTEWRTTYAQIEVTIVDEDGNALNNAANVPADQSIEIDWSSTDEIVFEDYARQINVEGYTFKEARYNGDVVTRLVATERSSGRRTTRSITFHNGDEKVGNTLTYSNQNEILASVELVYEPDQSAGLYIEDSVVSDGLFSAEFGEDVSISNDATVEYSWERSLTGQDNDWDPVYLTRVTGTHDNLENNGRSVNVAYDSVLAGADDDDRYWYRVTAVVTTGDGEQTTYFSDALQVPYYVKLQNGGFEDPTYNSVNSRYQFRYGNSNFMQIPSGTSGLIWKTTANGGSYGSQLPDDYYIEIINNSRGSTSNPYGVSGPYEGSQFAELNCESYGALYQDVLTVPGAQLTWHLSHAGRNGTDEMALVIMPVDKAEELTAALEEVSGNPDRIRELLNSYDQYGEVVYITDKQGVWGTHRGTYTVEDGQYVTRFFFVAVDAAGGSTQGNLLDQVGFGSDPAPAEDDEGQVTVTKVVQGFQPGVGDAEDYSVTVSVTNGSDINESTTLDNFSWNSQLGAWIATDTLYIEDLTPHQDVDVTVTETVSGAPQGYEETSSVVAVDHEGNKEAEGKTISEVTVTPGGSAATVTFTNSYEVVASYGVFIYKGAAAEDVDGSTIADPKKPLAGATFTVTDEAGTVVATGETGPDGFLSLGGNLSSGTYTISETQVPAGYTLLGYNIILQINEDGSAKFTMNGQEVGAETVNEANPAAAVSYPESSEYFYLALANYEDDPIPSTGGMGNAPLYVVGAVAVTGSVIALRRRQQAR